ncbi:MAG: Zn-dependent protease/CBS domain-containing protein [Natronomonas sp.]|jgi:Zn-dependent protease/CBS domain-containing protein
MFKAFRVGSVRGIPIKLDVTLLLILPAIAYLIGSQMSMVVTALNEGLGARLAADALTGGLLPWALGFAAGIGLFACVLLHELGHAAVARNYGYEVGSITLWLLGGVARPEEQPERWNHELWIAVAGPVVSIALGVGCYLLFSVLTVEALVFLFGYLAVLNIVLAAFNMLPAFPLDGGRVLRALLGRSRDFVEATLMAVAVGKGFAVLFALVGILSLNVFLIAIAFFVYLAAAAEGKQTVLQAAFEGVTVGDVMTREVRTLSPDRTLTEVLDRMFRERHTGYPVVRDGRLMGVITLSDVRDVAPEERDMTTVAEAMSTDLKTVTADADAMDAIKKLSDEGVGRLVVTDASGRLVGLVTRSDLVTAMNLMQERRLTEGGESLMT